MERVVNVWEVRMSVSIIVPVYNAEKWVCDGVESIVWQKHVLEVILIEDGSTDKSFSECKRLADEYDKVKVLRHVDGRNRGPGASRNLGVRSASSEFVAFLDADDICLPERFEVPVGALNDNGEVDGVYEAVGTIFENEEARKRWDSLGWGELTTVSRVLRANELFYHLVMWDLGHFHLDGLVIRKNLFFRIGGFNESLRLHQDTDFCIKAAALGRLVPGRLGKAVALRRVHAGNRFVKKRDDALESRLLMWQSLDEWARKSEQKWARRTILEYRLWKILANRYRRQRKYAPALLYFGLSRIVGVVIEMRCRVLGAESF
jgi:glycosyltransferase involved in cell wall biosynthesis